MTNLRPFMRPGLDILFVALNPPVESNENGHYFSGKNSRFFQLLYWSGLIIKLVPKETGDEIVFGSTAVNYNGHEFGVTDLVEDMVETNSGKVRLMRKDVESLIRRIRQFEPRFVCVIHGKVRDALNRHPDIMSPLDYGTCGPVLQNSHSNFVLNYFPNGNNVTNKPKLEIFRTLRRLL